jgi:hypothetical protein
MRVRLIHQNGANCNAAQSNEQPDAVHQKN